MDIFRTQINQSNGPKKGSLYHIHTHNPQTTNPSPITLTLNKQDRQKLGLFQTFTHTEKYLILIYKALNLSQISRLSLALPKKKNSLAHSITDTQAPKKNHQRERAQVAQSFRAPCNGGGRICCCWWLGGGGGGRAEPEFAAGSPQAEA